MNMGTAWRPPFRPRGQSSRFVPVVTEEKASGFPEACVVSPASFNSC